MTSFYYDLAGRLTNTAYADGTIEGRVYDLMGRVVKIRDVSNNLTTNSYNLQGLLVAVTNAFGRVMSRTYDLNDRATNEVNSAGVSLNQTFDDEGRILTRTYPDSGVERFGYTTNFYSVTSYTSQITNIVLYAYDAAGRKTNEIHVGISTNRFTYNASGDLLTLVDGNNQTNQWRYNLLGLVTNKIDAFGSNLFIYAYDANRRLSTRWTPAKGNTGYAYDDVGNLTGIDYPTDADISMAYDALNRLTNLVTVGVFTNTYTFTPIGQLQTDDGPWPSDTITYSYTNRMRATLSLQQPSGSWTNGYQYDAIWRLKSVASPAGAFTYDYYANMGALTNASPLVQKLTLPNAAYITNNYDAVARLSSTTLKNSSHSILNAHSYGVNVGNQRTRQTRTEGDYVDYTYDASGQLTNAYGMHGGTNRLQEQFGYRYDPAGNLTIRTNNDLVQEFRQNILNQVTNISRTTDRMTVVGSTDIAATNVTVNTSNAVRYADNTFASPNQLLAADGTNTFTAVGWDSLGRTDTNTVSVYLPAYVTNQFDYNGNLLFDGRRHFEYDDENQLVRVWVTNDWKSDFGYDGKMRRRVRTEAAG